MIDRSALLKDLRGQLKMLQEDLRERAESAQSSWARNLRAEHERALRAERTAWSWTAWRDDAVDQAAVAWLVATTFVRFCEDNDLLVGATLDGRSVPVGWIAGPGDRTQRAEENLGAYVRGNPLHSRRHWLQHAFAVLAAQPAGAALVDPDHNPVWTAELSPEAATDLIAFWRRTDERGSLIHDFTDATLDTRFLGDLYQDLSDHAKNTYALLQTPVFVEEFILDRTLELALRETPLEELKVIDPTCGSGHFLLGAFDRIHRAWREQAPALDPKERVRRAMDAIHGVDINPFAVAIARFRLTVVGMLAAKQRSLVGLPAPGFHLAIGDSLLGEQGGNTNLLDGAVQDDSAPEEAAFQKHTDDLAEYADILRPGRYHVVVGNPPYITVKDKALNKLYRKAYKTTKGKYALSVPFMELFFRLAIRGEQGVSAGRVGQITSNSFMKREFGQKVIEDLFAGYHHDNPVDLTEVIDTSGAYIPGHGTPTVILVGRRRRPQGDTVRAVMGVRGEPGQPGDPAEGLVWSDIVGHLEEPGYDGTYVSVTDLDRETLRKFPWSLSGGGASAVMGLLDAAATHALKQEVESIGFAAITGDDEVFVRGIRSAAARLDEVPMRPFIEGNDVRDLGFRSSGPAVYPYPVSIARDCERVFWPYRKTLSAGLMFGKTRAAMGMWWGEYVHSNRRRLDAAVAIVYSDLATHNHFAISRGGFVYNRHAPVLLLPPSGGVDCYTRLFGILNSSTACFWLKQVSHNKGDSTDSSGARVTGDPAFDTYEFTGTKLQEYPLPARGPLERARTLDTLAQRLRDVSPSAVVQRWIENSEGSLFEVLSAAELESNRLRERMIYEQEELDWEVYGLYELLDEGLTYGGVAFGHLGLGQRAFEVALARRVAEGTEQTAWFERHSSTPITDLPTEWPEDYRKLVQRRLDLVETDRSIRLLEQPEFKRRWATTPWSKQRQEAVGSAILDRLEQPELWQDPQGSTTRTVAELADLLRRDEALTELVRTYAGQVDPEIVTVLGTLVKDQAVPYLAAHRYKPSGLEKFREWQTVWDLQRREDDGEVVQIPVPPKYTSADFRKPSYWSCRGKLDVPKERFILYPDARREGDPTPLLGWAGWSHRDQALALAREVSAQQSIGAEDSLTPLVAGLVELEPWVRQWHSDLEPQFGTSAADVVASQIDQHLATLEKTRDQVTAWTPPSTSRARRTAAAGGSAS